jgi:hypothetical protein
MTDVERVRRLGLAFDALDGIVGLILITVDDRVSPEYRKELQEAYDAAHRILEEGGIDR